MDKEINKAIRFSTFVRFFLRIFSAVTSFFLFRLLNVEDYGAIALAIGIVTLVIPALLGGIDISYLRGGYKKFEKLSAIFTVYFLIAILGFLIILVLTSFTKIFSEIKNDYLLPSQIVFLKLVLSVPLFCARMAAQQEKKIDVLATAEITAFTLASSGAVLLAFTGYGVWSLVVQNLLIDLIFIIFVMFRLKWIPNIDFDYKFVWRLFKSGYLTNVDTLSFVIRERFIKIMIGSIFGLKVLGYYDIAHRLLMQVVSIFMAPSIEGVGASLSISDSSKKKIENEKTIALIFATSSQLINYVLIPLLLAASILPIQVFQIYTGKNYQTFGTFLSLACLYTALFSYEFILAKVCAFLLPIKKLWLRTLPVIVLTILMGYFIVPYGLNYITVALISLSAVNLIIMFQFLGIKKTWIVFLWFRIMCTSLILYLLLKSVVNTGFNYLLESMPHWVSLGVMGLAIINVYWIVIYLTHKASFFWNYRKSLK